MGRGYAHSAGDVRRRPIPRTEMRPDDQTDQPPESEPGRPSVVAVVATHNRVRTTIRCLESLLSAAEGVDLTVVHVDDGSTDGTAEAVRDLVPDVVQFSGDGSLYWAGAMRIGLDHAATLGPDHILWLNDDVSLESWALTDLIETTGAPNPRCIAVGALRDPVTDELSYSAVIRSATWRGREFTPVQPGDHRAADSMNGNLVLVPRSAYSVLGNLDPAYRHAIADFDYGLRASESGIDILTTRRWVGSCSRNPDRGTWRDRNLTRRERLRRIQAPTGRPFREWARFQRRNGGNWPLAAIRPYLRILAAPVTRRDPDPARAHVSIVYKSLPHYRVPLYELLRDELAAHDVELHLLIGDPAVGEAARRDTAWISWAERVRQRQWSIRGRQLVWQSVLRRTRHHDLVVVEQASKLVVNNLLAIGRHLGGPALGLWGHGVNRDEVNRSQLGEWWKRRSIRSCDWWFAYTRATAGLVAGAGVPATRITDLRNATDTSALRRRSEQLAGSVQSAGHPPTMAFIGSLYEGKGLNELVLTADRVRERIPDAELVVVGDGEDRELLERAASTRPWLHLTGAVTGTELAETVRHARCLLCPAAVGLVVLDAFALGLPVVTARASNHGPEIEYVVDGVNGLVVDRPAADPEYAEAVIRVLTESDLHDRLLEGCRDAAGQYTVEETAARFADGILRCLGRR